VKKKKKKLVVNAGGTGPFRRERLYQRQNYFLAKQGDVKKLRTAEMRFLIPVKGYIRLDIL
jgi:hypothetical protein